MSGDSFDLETFREYVARSDDGPVLDMAPDVIAEVESLRAEIARLRLTDAQREANHWRLESEVHRRRAAAAVAEIARLRLTAAEREAIEWFADIDTGGPRTQQHAAALQSLLKRLGGGK